MSTASKETEIACKAARAALHAAVTVSNGTLPLRTLISVMVCMAKTGDLDDLGPEAAQRANDSLARSMLADCVMLVGIDRATEIVANLAYHGFDEFKPSGGRDDEETHH